jgi:hypothetical protein
VLEVDHVTIGAHNLEQGRAYVRERLAVDLPLGGKHPDMATHNRLMRLGESLFFEVIATDPEAPAPGRIRWFGLDGADLQSQLAARPKPVGWVVRTDDIEDLCRRSPVDLGRIVNLSRGDRTWRLTVPDDGQLPFDGLMPAFIEWSPGPHPAVNMQFLGPTFERVVLRHPDSQKMAAIFDSLGLATLASIEHDSGDRPTLRFELRSAEGKLCYFE